MERGTRHGAVLLLLAALAATGCGYFTAGSWEDDPKTWHRIFGENPPEDVRLVHSFYERFPGFAMKYTVFREIDAPASRRDWLVQRLELKPLVNRPAASEIVDAEVEAPTWFLPGGVDRYDVWLDSLEHHLRLFVDRDSGRMFLSDRRP